MQTATAAPATDETYTPGDAPDYIAKDTYDGQWSRLGIPANHRVATFPARELAEIAPEGKIWEFVGHVNGRPLFSRKRYVADEQGNLHLYTSSGGKILIHPAARTIQALARS